MCGGWLVIVDCRRGCRECRPKSTYKRCRRGWIGSVPSSPSPSRPGSKLFGNPVVSQTPDNLPTPSDVTLKRDSRPTQGLQHPGTRAQVFSGARDEPSPCGHLVRALHSHLVAAVETPHKESPPCAGFAPCPR